MKIITLGEIMLRLSTEGNLRFVQANKLDATYGGGEANVCVSLTNYGHETYFVSKLPTHEIGQAAINSLRALGVHTDYVVRGGERVGIYFLETGASMRASQVIYDRADSSIAKAKVEDFDFDKIMQGKDWFHWTGITPAISKNGLDLVYAACQAAKKHKVKISVDLNFRKKLWTSEQAIAALTPLMKYVDVCIGNEEDAEKCLGFKAGKTNVEGAHLEVEGFKSVCTQLVDKFGFEYVASSMRESHSASDNTWSGIIYSKAKNEFYHSDKYQIRPIVDRVGGGDSFASALIHGINSYSDFKKGLDFAVAASALKHTIFGDFNYASLKEVETLMSGDKSGRVQR